MVKFIIIILVMFLVGFEKVGYACFEKGFQIDEILIQDLRQQFKYYLTAKENKTKSEIDVIKEENQSNETHFTDLTQKIAFPFLEHVDTLDDIINKEEDSVFRTQSHFVQEKFSNAHKELTRMKSLYPYFLEIIKLFTIVNIKNLKSQQRFKGNTDKKLDYILKMHEFVKMHEYIEINLKILNECIDFNTIPKKKDFSDTEAMLEALLDINIFLQKEWKPYYLFQIKKRLN